MTFEVKGIIKPDDPLTEWCMDELIHLWQCFRLALSKNWTWCPEILSRIVARWWIKSSFAQVLWWLWPWGWVFVYWRGYGRWQWLSELHCSPITRLNIYIICTWGKYRHADFFWGGEDRIGIYMYCRCYMVYISIFETHRTWLWHLCTIIFIDLSSNYKNWSLQ